MFWRHFYNCVFHTSYKANSSWERLSFLWAIQRNFFNLISFEILDAFAWTIFQRPIPSLKVKTILDASSSKSNSNIFRDVGWKRKIFSERIYFAQTKIHQYQFTLIYLFALVNSPSVVCLDASAPRGTISFSLSKHDLKCALL